MHLFILVWNIVSPAHPCRHAWLEERLRKGQAIHDGLSRHREAILSQREELPVEVQAHYASTSG